MGATGCGAVAGPEPGGLRNRMLGIELMHGAAQSLYI